MTPSARLSAVVELLDINFEITGRAEQSVATYFRNRRFAGSKDRRWITEQFYQILRRLGELDWVLGELDLKATSRSRAVLSLVLFNELSVSDLTEGFFVGTHALSEPDEDEINAYAKAATLDLTAMPTTARANFPLWMLEKLQAAHGDKTAEILQAFAVRAPATLRVNPLKGNRADVLAKLSEEGIEANATKISPLGFTLVKTQNLISHPLFKEGVIEVQDEAAQISALLANAAPGSTVVDYCAGAGGKALVLAASMENSGQLYALDIQQHRMKDIAHRCKRAGLDNVQQHILPAKDEKHEILAKLAGRADLVYVDAPCSGSGTWRRQPEQKWFLDEKRLGDYIKLQREILKQASDYVKPGGRLVYATCSLFAEENQNQIEAFLSKNMDFERVSISDVWSETELGEMPVSNPDLQITPDQFGADGFFTAILRRKD